LDEAGAGTESNAMDRLPFTLAFLILAVILPLSTAILVSVVRGLPVLAVFSHETAVSQGQKPWKMASEHLLIAFMAIDMLIKYSR